MQRRYDELRQAVSTGEAAEVEKVLARGTWDLNALDVEGHTALHKAIFSGYLDVVKVLLAHGADPNVRAGDGLPALSIALNLGMREIADLLLGHGAKLATVRSDNVGAPAAAAWLVYTDVDRLRVVPLTPPGVVIGRDPGQCDVALQDFGISRRHARIDVRSDGQMTLTDLKSKGGCQVNGVSVVDTTLAVGDRLLLGKVEFIVVASLPAAPRVVESATPGLRELSALIAQPTVTLEEKLAWIDGICARVAAAHEKGVVHGDLHNRRITAAPDGRVEVDFSPTSVPLPGQSPEQFLGRLADARSDVFAAACIAYELLAGRPPFEGETLHAVIYRILHEDPPDPRQLVPSLPEALAAWLQRGLAKEPAERFADGAEMLEALRRVLASGQTKRGEVRGALTSHDAQAWFEKGMAAIDLSNGADSSSERRDYLADAVAALSEATLRAPRHVEAWFQMGLALREMGRESDAVAAFDSVTGLRSDDVEAWFQKADALCLLRRDTEAVAACDEVLRRVPTDVAALYIKVITLLRVGHHQDVLAACDAVLGSDGALSHGAWGIGFDVKFRARLHKGSALAALGRSAEARAAFAEAFAGRCRESATSEVVLEALAQFPEARIAYLEGTRDKAKAWRLFGFAFSRAGQAADALVAFERAIGLAPEDPDAWWGKADALVECGRREEAIPAYRECLRLRPGRPPVQRRLEVLLMDLRLPDASPVPEAASRGGLREDARGRRKADVAEFRCALCRLFASVAALGSSPTAVSVRLYLDPRGGPHESSRVPLPAGQDRTAVHAIRKKDAQALYDLEPEVVPLYCPRCSKTYCVRHWTIDAAVSTRVRSCPEGHPRAMGAKVPSVVGEPSLPNHLRAMHEASGAIASNADYVLREIGALGVPEELRRRIQTVWRDLHGASQEVETTLARVEAKSARDPLEEIEWIENRVGQRLLALDDLVKAFGTTVDDDPALAAVSILVGESGANAFRAFADLRRHGEGFREQLPIPDRVPRTLREEAGVPEYMDLKQELRCASCGKTAATLEVAIDPVSGSRALVYSGLVRREAFSLTLAQFVFEKLAKGEVGEAHASLGGEGMDAYCPECGRVYCRDHYKLETEHDDGFYDCTRGTCPAGHRRMVDD